MELRRWSVEGVSWNDAEQVEVFSSRVARPLSHLCTHAIEVGVPPFWDLYSKQCAVAKARARGADTFKIKENPMRSNARPLPTSWGRGN